MGSYQELLTRGEFEELVDICCQMGLAVRTKRSVLLAHIPPRVVMLLDDKDSPRDQIVSDLSTLVKLPMVEGLAEPPLVVWLENAAQMIPVQQEQKRLLSLAKQVPRRVHSAPLHRTAAKYGAVAISASLLIGGWIAMGGTADVAVDPSTESDGSDASNPASSLAHSATASKVDAFVEEGGVNPSSSRQIKQETHAAEANLMARMKATLLLRLGTALSPEVASLDEGQHLGSAPNSVMKVRAKSVTLTGKGKFTGAEHAGSAVVEASIGDVSVGGRGVFKAAKAKRKQPSDRVEHHIEVGAVHISGDGEAVLSEVNGDGL